MGNEPSTPRSVMPESQAQPETATTETAASRRSAAARRTPAARLHRLRAVFAGGAVIALAASAGTGVMLQSDADAREQRIAETEALAAAGIGLNGDQLVAQDVVLGARAGSAAEDALEAAKRAVERAAGLSDASMLESTVAALGAYEQLSPGRVFDLVDAARSQTAAVEAAAAEAERLAAEQAAAEEAARLEAERAAAEAAEQAAAEQSAGDGGGAPAAPPAAPSSPSDAQLIARDMMAANYGWGDDQFGCLVAVWDYESGWNVTASNPNGAYGIPQALPGDKMASAGPDWQTNAATQIAWGLGYIAGRYGDPCGAWAHIQSTGWY